MRNIQGLKNFSKGVLFYAFSILCIYLSFKLFIFYMPFLIAFIFSQLLEPMIRFINKKTGVTRKTSSIFVIIVFFVLIISLISWGIVLLVTETTSFLGKSNEYLEKLIIFAEDISNKINFDGLKINSEIKVMFQNTATDLINESGKFIRTFLTKFLNALTSLPTIIIYTVITILSTYFIASDKFYIIDQMEYHFPKKWVGKLRENVRKITSSLAAYIKAEIIMIFISFFIVLIGLLLFNALGLNIEYPIIIAILIGFVDALPILRKWNYSYSLVFNILFKSR